MIIQTPSSTTKNGYKFIARVVDLRIGKVHEIETYKNKVQRIQFLYTPTKSGRYYLLLFIEKYTVQRWKIRTQGIGDYKIQAEFQKDIVKDFFWYEWERHKNILYILSKTSSRSPSMDQLSKKLQTGLYACQLKCIHLSEAERTDTLWEIPLAISLPSTIEDKRLYYFTDHRCRLPSSRFFHIVQLNGVMSLLFQNLSQNFHLHITISPTNLKVAPYYSKLFYFII